MRTLPSYLAPRVARYQVGATQPVMSGYGKLTADAYLAIQAPPLQLGDLAAGSSGLLTGSLEVSGAVSGDELVSTQDLVIGKALQICEKLGEDLAHGLLDGVVAEVTTSLPDLANLAGELASAVPIVGTAVSVIIGAVDALQKERAAAEDHRKQEVLAKFVPIEPSFGGKLVPGDYFWNAVKQKDTSVGVLVDALTGGGVVFSGIFRPGGSVAHFWSPKIFREWEKFVSDSEPDDYGPDTYCGSKDDWARLWKTYRAFNGLPYGELNSGSMGDPTKSLVTSHEADPFPMTKAEQVYLHKLYVAIRACSGNYNTDGGFALYTAFVDALSQIRERIGHERFERYLYAVRSTYGFYCAEAWWDNRAIETLIGLVESWQQRVDEARVRGLAKVLPETMRAIALSARGKAYHPHLVIRPVKRATTLGDAALWTALALAGAKLAGAW